MIVTMRATYTDMWYETDEPDTEPMYETGFTQPHNPWGGWKIRTDEEGAKINAGDTTWPDAYIEVETFNNLWDAAEFVVEFPGGVWDFREGEYSTIDYRKGVDREVTLHVGDEHKVAVLELAAFIQGMQDRKLKRMQEAYAR